jgi:excinuclease ABC subunit A
MLSHRGKTKCYSCKGKRLRIEASYVKINSNRLWFSRLANQTFGNVFERLELDVYEKQIAHRLLLKLTIDCPFDRSGFRLSDFKQKLLDPFWWESQRINLATSLGSSLVGSMYILDEPSIGHTKRYGAVDKSTFVITHDIGNTNCRGTWWRHYEGCWYDYWYWSGSFGGELVAQGTFEEILKSTSLTAKYLNGELEIAVPKKRRHSRVP